MNFNFLLNCIIIFCCMCYGEPTHAENAFTNPVVEQWVIDQIQSNGYADLKVIFPEENDRRVGYALVSNVLRILGDSAVPVVIENAVFVDPFVPAGINIKHSLMLNNCKFLDLVNIVDIEVQGLLISDGIFNGPVSITGSNFNRNLMFTDSKFKASFSIVDTEIDGRLDLSKAHFENFVDDVMFNGVVVKGDVGLAYSSFNGPVYMNSTHINNSLIATGATFQKSATFHLVDIHKDVLFNQTLFYGPFYFINSQVGKNLITRDAIFWDENIGASFNGIIVNGSAFFDGKAKFNGPVDLQAAQIQSNLQLDGAQFLNPKAVANFAGIRVGNQLRMPKAVFKGGANFQSASIESSLVANDASFLHKKAVADFNSIKVGGTADFMGKVRFNGPVDFQVAQIQSNLQLDGAQFLNPEAEANFAGIRVGNQLRMPKAVFKGGASFNTASIESSLNADDVSFLHEKAVANFNSIKVGGTADFMGKVRFNGPVDFQGAQIQSNLQLDGAQFLNPEAEANFAGIRVGNQLRMPKAVFKGGANFESASIESHLIAEDTKFLHPTAVANFYSIKVGGAASFRGEVQFEGPVSLYQMSVGNSFSAEGARFNGLNTTFDMGAMSVKGNFILRNTRFASPLSLDATSIVGSLKADPAEFRGPGRSLSLDNTKILGNTTLSASSISGELSLVGAEFSDLFIDAKPTENIDLSVEGFQTLKRLELSRSNVNGKLTIQGVTADEFYMSEVNVKGLTIIQGASFMKQLTLDSSKLNTLSLNDVRWPNDPSSFSFRGVSYQGLEVGCSRKVKNGIDKTPNSCKPSSEQVIIFLEDMRYDSSTYLDYENSLMRQGRDEEADNVYIARKERERRENNSWFSNVWNLFLFYSAAYGRHPEYSFLISLILVIVGMRIFREQNMVSANEDQKIPYSSFWFSLDRFLPVIGDLHGEEKWFPKEEKKWHLLYWRFLPYFGWFLLPLFLASVTGLLK